jgi:hypothetical protein
LIGHGPFENGILFLKEALFLAFPAVSVIDQRHELLSHRIDPSLYALMPQELTMVGKSRGTLLLMNYPEGSTRKRSLGITETSRPSLRRAIKLMRCFTSRMAM